MKFKLQIAALAILITSLAACTGQAPDSASGNNSEPRDAVTDPSSAKGSKMPQQNPPNPVPSELMSRMMDEVVADSGMDRGDIRTVRAEKVTWPDGSLGCPEPGMNYTQALVPGYWVELRADATEYDFRATAKGQFVRCTAKTRRQPISDSDT